MPRLTLSIEDHSRDSAGMRYVYPVVSRRAGGVSIGVNLNPNNACNWRCIYCQVPGLVRGGPPPLDLLQLDAELDRFLEWAIEGDFMARHVPPESRRLVDVAFSGNGEPTSAPEFDEAIDCVLNRLAKRRLEKSLIVRVITNGSLIDRRAVKSGLSRLGRYGGEAWFKVDAGTSAGFNRINGSRLSPDAVGRRLDACAGLVTTWVQTCVFRFKGRRPSRNALAAYLELLRPRVGRLAGVHLYGLARPSMQAEATELGRLSEEEMESIADSIRRLGLDVTVNP